jgi:molybdenum cofactor cytidylyltransferase
MSAANRNRRRVGVILAAGRGRRMGGTKQLKLWPAADGPKPLICAAYDAIRPICDEVVVVLGHEADAVAGALRDRAFVRAESPAQQPMIDSIRVGLRAAAALDSNAAVVLQPGDHPEVSATTLQAIAKTASARPDQAIIAEHHGRGGHPVLIPACVAKVILASPCPEGLGQFWLDHPELCHRFAVDDASMLRDIDTPANLPD